MDTIKVLKDMEEEEDIRINKNIILDTNGKTIKMARQTKIIVNDDIKCIVKGAGNLYLEDDSSSFIMNHGELKIEDVTIKSDASGISGIIYTDVVLVINSGNIGPISEGDNFNSIFIDGGNVTINGGNILGNIRELNQYGYGSVLINNGKIKEIDARNGCNCTINGGTIDEIMLGTNAGDINLTIGNINENVNTNNPEIKNIKCTTGDLAGIESQINFYNGIVKQDLMSFSEEVILWELNIREGYTASYDSNLGGTILISN